MVVQPAEKPHGVCKKLKYENKFSKKYETMYSKKYENMCNSEKNGSCKKYREKIKDTTVPLAPMTKELTSCVSREARILKNN